MKKFNLAIVGATGLVGQKLLEILKEENLIDCFDIRLFVSERSAGKTINFYGKNYELILLEHGIKNFDFAFFSSGDEVSREFAKDFVDGGAFVIDNSNAFRREPSVPLVVPEINENLVTKKTKIISNPNCSTIELVLVLDKLSKLSKLKKVIVSTYQSVSGAGMLALKDLEEKTNLFSGEMFFENAIAHIGSFSPDGFSTEEDKIMFESKKILNQEFDIVASAVRVPIHYTHLESVFVEFENEIDFKKIESLFDGKVISYSKDVVLSTEVADTNKTVAFRFRKVNEKEITFFVLADNLRRGASYNAVLILKRLMNLIEPEQS